MSKEIVEAVQALEREKGITSEKLMIALEDALLSAYKKTPGAAKYARVDMDRHSGDFRVFELILPPELTSGEKCWVCCQATVVRVEESGQEFGVAAQIRRMDLLPEMVI